MSPSFLNDPLVWLRKYRTRTRTSTSSSLEEEEEEETNHNHNNNKHNHHLNPIMGCVQGKPFSPHRGLDKLKLESGYIPKGDHLQGDDQSRRRSSTATSSADDHTTPSTLPLFDSDPLPARNFRVPGDSGGSEGERKDEEEDEDVIDGWPRWLVENVPRAVLASLVPKSADNYEKIDKVGQGTYSNVYKAREKRTGKVVALKKVRFDTSEPESIKFMAREIMILQKLDHPNVIKLAGLATSRMQYSIYLVFDFMPADLSTVITRSDGKLTEPQVKCYMQQLLSGLQHCHDRGILHRDIKGSNLLIDKDGTLKIADFGLANYYNPKQKRPLTSRVVTLWYRAPELLLGSTDYGVGIDLWSAGCLLAEMFLGRPIMQGRTEVEQLHKIFKLCGMPSEDYWKKLKPSKMFRPPQPYKPSFFIAFRDFPEPSWGLLTTLLSLDPKERGTASSALQHKFFSTNPLACDLSGLPVILRDDDDLDEAYEQRRRNSKTKRRSQTQREGTKKDVVPEITEQGYSKAKQEEDRIIERNNRTMEPGSSTTTTSTSSPGAQGETLPFLLSPEKSPNNHQDHVTNGHKSARTRPPLPANRTSSNKYNANNRERDRTNANDNMYRTHHQVQRSSSSREFRRVNPRKPLDL